MPSVTYMNESAPFWDFIASLEQQGSQHPMFGGNNTTNTNNDNNTRNEHERNDAGRQDPFGQQPFGPWGWGQFFGGGQGMPYRGPPGAGEESNQQGEAQREGEKEKQKEAEKKDECDNGEGPSGTSGSDNEGHRRRHGRCGGRRGRCGPGGSSGFGGPCEPSGFGGPGQNGFGGPWGRGGFGPRRGPPRGHHHGREHWGPWGRGAPFRFECPDPSAFAAQFLNQFTDIQNNDATNKNDTSNEDHTPDADIFDTESAFVIHVSLPGAKKEDIGVNWDAEKSELCIAGVIYRPGDEALLKTLAMGERKVGAFERKIRLGTRASPASIDAEGITAKLEDGVLRVVVGKVEEGFVEVRKVDIE